MRRGHPLAGGGSLDGVAAGGGAGLVWGLAFLVPVLLHGWSAVAVTTGRYLAYGLVSALLFLAARRGMRGLARRHWRPALAFAIAGNAGYYLLLVLGIDLVGAPVTDIIIGAIPVTMALVANLTARTYPWPKLAVPVALATAGLLLATVPGSEGHGAHHPPIAELFGLVAAFGAVALWTWYGLANARFLSRHPQLPHTRWSTLVGLYTGAVTLLSLPLALATGQLGGSGPRSVGWLAGGSIVLGVGVSWGATALWNLASARLPAVSAGMLVNVETVAGYAYVYAAQAHWPPPVQVLGFALLILGVLIVVRLPATPAKHQPPARQPAAHPRERAPRADDGREPGEYPATRLDPPLHGLASRSDHQTTFRSADPVTA